MYSDAEEVELFQNDKSLGRKPAGEKNRFKARFETTYEPGTLRAAAYQNGRFVSEFQIRTAGSAAKLLVCADRHELCGNGQDLAYVTISLVDETGLLNDDVCKHVNVRVEGNGVLQGLGTGDPMSTENFFAASHQTFEGRLLAVVRATDPGTILVHCDAEGLDPVCLTLTARD